MDRGLYPLNRLGSSGSIAQTPRDFTRDVDFLLTSANGENMVITNILVVSKTENESEEARLKSCVFLMTNGKVELSDMDDFDTFEFADYQAAARQAQIRHNTVDRLVPFAAVDLTEEWVVEISLSEPVTTRDVVVRLNPDPRQQLNRYDHPEDHIEVFLIRLFGMSESKYIDSKQKLAKDKNWMRAQPRDIQCIGQAIMGF